MQAALCGERTAGTATMQDNPTPLAFRRREAAKMLGISERLLWQLTKDRRIPFVHVGGTKRKTVLYPLAELEAWLGRKLTTEGDNDPR